MADFLGKGWKFPISVGKGKIVMVEDEESIKESVMLILGTAKGERVMRPDFGCGLQELAFAPNNMATATLASFYVKEALREWEPRIKVLEANAVPDAKQENQLNINIVYEIKTSNTKENLVYPFYLDKAGR